MSHMSVALLKTLDSVYATETEFTSVPFLSKWEHIFFLSVIQINVSTYEWHHSTAQYSRVLGLRGLLNYIPGIITENMS